MTVQPQQISPQQQQIERLTAMAERLMEALETDIAALEAGRPKHMRMIEPEVQRLSILFSREVKTVDPASARAAPREVRQRFVSATGRFRDLLHRHMRLVGRVRNASEGIIKAVASDAERRRNAMRPYTAPKTVYRSRPGALVYNSVV